MVKLWFIDDQATDNFYHKTLIEEMGQLIEVQFFDDSEEALNKLRATSSDDLPEGIFLDVNMPKIDGFEFLEELEEDEDDVKFDDLNVYMLTCSNLLRDREMASKYPVIRDFIEKPLSKDKLLQLIG